MQWLDFSLPLCGWWVSNAGKGKVVLLLTGVKHLKTLQGCPQLVGASPVPWPPHYCSPPFQTL